MSRKGGQLGEGWDEKIRDCSQTVQYGRRQKAGGSTRTSLERNRSATATGRENDGGGCLLRALIPLGQALEHQRRRVH